MFVHHISQHIPYLVIVINVVMLLEWPIGRGLVNLFQGCGNNLITQENTTNETAELSDF